MHHDRRAPPERVWELVADPAATPRFMDGRHRAASVEGRRRERAGRALLDAHAGGLGRGRRPGRGRGVRRAAATSRGRASPGIDQRGRWRLREPDDGAHARSRCGCAYDAPGGVLGALSEQVSAPHGARRARASLARRLRAEIEGGAHGGERGTGGMPATAGNEAAARAKVLADGGRRSRPMRPDRPAHVRC